MQKPLILTVDDDTEVPRAMERDLKKHYEAHYCVLRAESGRAALDLLRRLQQRNNAVALLYAHRFVIAPPADTAGAVNTVAIQPAEALIAAAVAQIRGHVAFYPEWVDEMAEQLPT